MVLRKYWCFFYVGTYISNCNLKMRSGTNWHNYYHIYFNSSMCKYRKIWPCAASKQGHPISLVSSIAHEHEIFRSLLWQISFFVSSKDTHWVMSSEINSSAILYRKKVETYTYRKKLCLKNIYFFKLSRSNTWKWNVVISELPPFLSRCSPFPNRYEVIN